MKRTASMATIMSLCMLVACSSKQTVESSNPLEREIARLKKALDAKKLPKEHFDIAINMAKRSVYDNEYVIVQTDQGGILLKLMNQQPHRMETSERPESRESTECAYILLDKSGAAQSPELQQGKYERPHLVVGQTKIEWSGRNTGSGYLYPKGRSDPSVPPVRIWPTRSTTKPELPINYTQCDFQGYAKLYE